MRCRIAVLLVLALLGAAPAARADDRIRAAEHFALAESAERRGDYRAAIDEYRRAYELSPHPSVLYNIGLAHEKLGSLRAAAEHYLRYLDESDDAEDRDQVLARIAALRERPSVVRIDTEPTGATVHVDGVARGPAPLELELPGGEHEVSARMEGRAAARRTLALSYGEPAELSLDLTARPGILQVFADADRAEVWIDGAPAGRAPLTTALPSGRHQVVVRAPGRRDVTREVTVPADGSEQVRAVLEVVPGAAGEVEDEVAADQRRGGFLVGTAYGFVDSALRYQLELGARLLGERVDAGVLLGTFGPTVGLGVGAQVRLYPTTGPVRPFARGTAALGAGDGMNRVTTVEAGGGVLYGYGVAVRQSAYQQYALEYYLDVAVQWRQGDGEDASLSVPVTLGVLWRWGGADTPQR